MDQDTTRFYGMRYGDAQSLQGLIAAAGEACCVAAISILQMLRFQQRGRPILDCTGCSKAECRWRYNFAFSHCLFFITRRFQSLLEKELGDAHSARETADAVYMYAGSSFSLLAGLSRQEEEALIHELEVRTQEYSKEELDEERLVLNIADGLNRPVQLEQLIFFLEDLVNDNPVSLVEPMRFCQRFIALKSGSGPSHEKKNKRVEPVDLFASLAQQDL